MFEGTFYLEKVDEKFRRFYKIKGKDGEDIRKEESFFNWTGAIS